MNILSSIYFEIISRCNLACSYCYNDSGVDETIFPLSKFADVLATLKESNLQFLSISGGEPFLVNKIIDYVDIAVKVLPNTTIEIVTNGSLLDSKLIESLSPFLSRVAFSISIDDVNADSHCALRIGSDLVQLKRNIDMLSKVGATFRFGCVLTTVNHEHIEDLIKYGIQMKSAGITFNFMKRKGRAVNQIELLALSPSMKYNVIKKLNALQTKYLDRISITYPKHVNPKCDIFRNELQTDKQFSIRIDPMGNVYPCQIFTSPKAIIGNVYNEILVDIINGSKIHDLIQKLSAWENPNCNTCSIMDFCEKGCPGIDWDSELYADDEDCQLRKTALFNECIKYKIGAK